MRLVVLLVIGKPQTLPLILADITGFLPLVTNRGDKENLRVFGLKGIDLGNKV